MRHREDIKNVEITILKKKEFGLLSFEIWFYHDFSLTQSKKWNSSWRTNKSILKESVIMQLRYLETAFDIVKFYKSLQRCISDKKSKIVLFLESNFCYFEHATFFAQNTYRASLAKRCSQPLLVFSWKLIFVPLWRHNSRPVTSQLSFLRNENTQKGCT